MHVPWIQKSNGGANEVNGQTGPHISRRPFEFTFGQSERVLERRWRASRDGEECESNGIGIECFSVAREYAAACVNECAQLR
jgi:hypothetical protein